jgi:hypothetical protein
MLDELRSHDAWTRERLLEDQRARLRAMLEHAVSSSPWYRERTAACGPATRFPRADRARSRVPAAAGSCQDAR